MYNDCCCCCYCYGLMMTANGIRFWALTKKSNNKHMNTKSTTIFNKKFHVKGVYFRWKFVYATVLWCLFFSCHLEFNTIFGVQCMSFVRFAIQHAHKKNETENKLNKYSQIFLKIFDTKKNDDLKMQKKYETKRGNN